MSRWGAALFWLGVGSASVAACGGRTGAPDGELYGDDDGSFGGSGSGGSRAGAAGQGGSSNVAGARPIGGGAPVAGRGGASFGGTPGGGARPIGGTPGGGVGPIGGTPGGGVGPIGGAAGGGFAGFGAVGGTSPVDCQVCLTQACTPQVAQCFQDPGCVAIFSCVVSSGCSTFQCYSPMYCKGVIDQFGGPTGNSVGQVFDVVSCAVSSGCDC